MKRLLALLLILMLLPVVSLGEGTVSLRFEAEKVTYDAGTTGEIAVIASKAPEADLPFTVVDPDGVKTEMVMPAGETRVVIPVFSPISGKNTSRIYSLRNSTAYTRKTPFECKAVARGVCTYTFRSDVFYTTVGNELKVRIDIANPERLEDGTIIELRDGDGTVLETIVHNQKKSSVSFTYQTDASWRMGKRFTLWMAGRNGVQSEAIGAVSVPAIKSIYGVNRDDKKIAFTMDCGSSAENLLPLLDIYDDFGLKITFFVTGQFAASYPDLVAEIARRGHEIGNHSYSHPSFFNLTNEQMKSQMDRTNNLIAQLTGVTPVLFRPPYGDCNAAVRAVVNANGFEVIRWTHSCNDSDAKVTTPALSFKMATKDLTGGSIILSHVDSKGTFGALRDILTWYRDNGWEVVPVSQLLLPGETSVDDNGRQYRLQ